MVRTLVVLNAVVLMLLAAFAVIEALPGLFSPGLSVKTVLALLLLALPHLTALAAFCGLGPRYASGTSIVLNVVWSLLLFYLGAAAATGLGGAIGALFFMVPLLALTCFNAVALWHRLGVAPSACWARTSI